LQENYIEFVKKYIQNSFTLVIILYILLLIDFNFLDYKLHNYSVIK